MTQPYHERPVAPAPTADGPDEDAPVQAAAGAPAGATPPDATGDEAQVAQAPAGIPAGTAAAEPGAAEPGAAEPGAADTGALPSDPDATQHPAVTAPTDAAAPTDDSFGDPRVDDAVARLQELADRPVGEHAEVFDDIHQRLRDALEEAAVEPAEEPRG